MSKEHYKHFVIGENKICYPNEEFILKMDVPRVSIRYEVDEEHSSCNYDQFIKSRAEIQWMDEKPSESEQEKILTDMYHYMRLEEEILDEFIDDLASDISS